VADVRDVRNGADILFVECMTSIVPLNQYVTSVDVVFIWAAVDSAENSLLIAWAHDRRPTLLSRQTLKSKKQRRRKTQHHDTVFVGTNSEARRQVWLPRRVSRFPCPKCISPRSAPCQQEAMEEVVANRPRPPFTSFVQIGAPPFFSHPRQNAAIKASGFPAKPEPRGMHAMLRGVIIHR
jgi:hypothetical protein